MLWKSKAEDKLFSDTLHPPLIFCQCISFSVFGQMFSYIYTNYLLVADVSCDGGVVIWRQMCHVMEVWSEADVSCDGSVVIWRQMCHVMEVWSYGGRCVM